MTTTDSRVAVPRTRRANGRGLAWAVLSAATFGLSGSMAKSLLEIGWSPGAVVAARMGGAFLALVIPTVLILRGTGLPNRRQTRRMLTYGVVAVAGAQLSYFSAVQYLSVATALLLEYLAPVLLIGWQWTRTRTRPTTSVFAGAALAMAGMVLVLGVLHGLTLNPIGVLWGLSAAACLCVYFLLSDNHNSGASVHPLLMTTVGTGVGGGVMLAAGAVGALPLTFELRHTTLVGASVPWWVPVLVLILVSGALAYLTGIIAVRRLGSSVASFVSLSEVIFAVVFAVILLGQQPALTQVLGGVLVLAGIATVQRRPS